LAIPWTGRLGTGIGRGRDDGTPRGDVTMSIDRLCRAAGLFALALAATATPARADYQFFSFDGPGDITGGTTVNGISNGGVAVGFTVDAMGNLHNFTYNTMTKTTTSLPALPLGSMANGINSVSSIVGSSGVNAFSYANGTLNTLPFPTGAVSQVAFGINDVGVIAGQYTNAADQTPGFILNNGIYSTINAPSGPNIVNAQGINNNGLVVGFYVGNDGQFHGFTYDSKTALGTGTPVADPTIPAIPGEPGATFVFSQILGINDQGIAVGYFGDSTTSQHGFLYDTHTGHYTFLDAPFEQFSAAGVEVTQITGITNSGELTGFYTDLNGTPHGFYALAVPEPGSMVLLGVGLAGVAAFARRRPGPARRAKTSAREAESI
jgi:hypothetical protein